MTSQELIQINSRLKIDFYLIQIDLGTTEKQASRFFYSNQLTTQKTFQNIDSDRLMAQRTIWNIDSNQLMTQ